MLEARLKFVAAMSQSEEVEKTKWPILMMMLGKEEKHCQPFLSPLP